MGVRLARILHRFCRNRAALGIPSGAVVRAPDLWNVCGNLLCRFARPNRSANASVVQSSRRGYDRSAELHAVGCYRCAVTVATTILLQEFSDMKQATRVWLSAVIVVGLRLVTPVTAQESAAIAWPQFRGVNSSGVADDTHQAPVEFGPNENVRWSIEIPTGHSSPCVWNDHIFLTSFEPESSRLELWSIERASGKTRWRRTIPAKEIEKGHPVFNPASSTPATDGDRVVAYFGSSGLVCFDFDGNQQWAVSMPVARTYAGNAISPIIVQDKAILYRATYQDHYLLAVSVATGEEIWKHEFSSRFRTSASCTGTPVVWRDQVVLHSLDGVRSHALRDGKPVWWVYANTTATSTPVLGDRHVFVATWTQTGERSLLPEQPDFDSFLKENDKNGDEQLTADELPSDLAFFHRPEGRDAPQSSMPIRFGMLDRNRSGRIERQEWEDFRRSSEKQRAGIRQHGLLAVRLGGKGDVTESHVSILERQSIPEVPSPIYHDGRVYIVKNGGILTCLNASTGERLYRKRSGSPGTHYASPILGNHVLYIASGAGQIAVVDISGETPEILAKNNFGEQIFATPAIIDNTLLVRTERRLYAIAAP